MPQRRSFDVLGVTRNNFLSVFILSVNAFSWYYMVLMLIEKLKNINSLTSTEGYAILIILCTSVIISSIVGSILSETQKLSFLYLWMAFGGALSLLPALLNVTPYVWSFALGFSFGIGMPACLAYFANFSTVENRGRLSGITVLTIYLSAAILSVAFSELNLTQGFILLASWRASGLFIFILLKPKSIANEKNKSVSFPEILKDKTLQFYIVPWIMFILIDRFVGPILQGYLNNPDLSLAVIIGPIIGGLSAFLGGVLSDRIGRKRVLIFGFVALGLAYAIVGIAPEMFISWYFYTVADGVAWGILLVILLLTVWGDLSQRGGRMKYYVIGGTPFFFTRILESFLNVNIMQIPPYTAFSLASFFLFIAVLPLLYAPETLSQRKIELRQFKGYVEKAKKNREKYHTKNSF